MITLYRGDDTGGQLGKNVKIAFHCDDAVDMDGVTVKFNLLNVITKEWTNVHDGDILEMFVTHEQSGMLPLGFLFGKIWGEDSSGKVRTFANRLPIIVTHDLRKVYGSDGLDSQDIHVYSSVDWDAIANKPALFPSKIELVEGLTEALDGMVKSVNGKTADAAGAVTLTLDSFANKDGEIQVKQTLMVSRDGGQTFNAVATLVDVWNEIDNHNSSATAHANLMAAIANTYARKSTTYTKTEVDDRINQFAAHIPSVSTTFTSDDAGKAADAKAVGEKFSEQFGHIMDIGNLASNAYEKAGSALNAAGLADEKANDALTAAGAAQESITDATKLTPVFDADGRVTGYKLGDKASPVLLTDDAKAALFAGEAFREAAFGKAATSAANLESGNVAVVDGSAGGTVTVSFKANATGDNSLRYCELLVTGVTADDAVTISLPAGTYQFADGADKTSKGNNHFVFAEYAGGWMVNKTVRTEATITEG